MARKPAFDNADGYELQMGRWSRQLAEPFLDFVGPVGEQLLDVGCGTGSLTEAILSRWPSSSVAGLDASEAFIARAKGRFGSRCDLRVGNAQALPYGAAQFNTVLSLLVLHFAEPETAIREMVRVAKPGALIGAAVWDAPGGLVAQRMFFDTAAVLDPAAVEARARQNNRPMCRPGELEAAWRGAGLIDVVGGEIATRMRFTSFDDFWMPYSAGQGGAAAYFASLDEARKLILRDHLEKAYLDGAPDGSRSFAAIAWAVRGRKPN